MRVVLTVGTPISSPFNATNRTQKNTTSNSPLGEALTAASFPTNLLAHLLHAHEPTSLFTFPCEHTQQAPVGQGEGELDSGGPEEVLCTELEWELIGLGTGGGAPHPDMPGLYRPHFLSSRPATPLEAFIQTQSAEKDVS